MTVDVRDMTDDEWDAFAETHEGHRYLGEPDPECEGCQERSYEIWQRVMAPY